MSDRIIAHIDMDAFFAACEERYNPQFAGMPIVVGADPKGGRGRGVVSTANYAARRYGIRSALPISRAWDLAEAAKYRGEPKTVFLQVDYSLYSEVSQRIMAIISRETSAFEQASIDEAYADISPLVSFDKAREWATSLKRQIKEQESLTCSIGIGPNKLIAKIASDFKKPSGLTVVEPAEVQGFLDPMPIRVIPGIGPKTETFLKGHSIELVKNLKDIQENVLYDWLGKLGGELYHKARGISDSLVSDKGKAKSIGVQKTLGRDTLGPVEIFGLLERLADAVYRRFQESSTSFRAVTLTVRFADFETLLRSKTLKKAEGTKKALNLAVTQLLLPFLDRRENPKLKKIRLLGVRVEKLN